MAPVTPATLLHPGALSGRAVVAPRPYGEGCAAVGAVLVDVEATRVDALVVDAGRAFGEGGLAGLRAAVDGAWERARGVAMAHWLEGGDGGSVVFVAPRAGAGEHAGAAAAALENLARTLAVEWARFDVRATVVVPGERVTSGELAALVAFLASPGGDYYSGCRFDLR